MNADKCDMCDFLCQTCFGPKSDNCCSCSSKYFFNQGSCIALCPKGKYADVTTRRCDKCNCSCKECNGPADN